MIACVLKLFWEKEASMSVNNIRGAGIPEDGGSEGSIRTLSFRMLHIFEAVCVKRGRAARRG